MDREMKDSNVKWIGEIPENWDVRPVKSAFYRKKDKAQQENPTVLSLARSGVRVRDISNNKGQLAASYENYNPVIPGDLLLNPMDLYSGANCNMSEIEGVISPAYVNLGAKDEVDPKFYDYFFKTQYWSMAFFAHGLGVSFDNRWTLNNETLMNYKIPVPNYKEQKKISEHLNCKVKEIDSIIDQTKQSIEEYKKYKQSLITEVVTKGLDPNVKMKDSGVEWIGEIPEHWEVIAPFRVCQVVRGNCDFQKTDLKDSGEYVALQYGKTYKVDEVTKDFGFYIDGSFYKENQIVESGDTILISTSETLEDLGHSCFYNRNDIGLLGGEQMCLKPNNSLVYDKFLFYATRYFNYELTQYATGLKVYRFKVYDLKKINFILPPKHEQPILTMFLDEKLPLIDGLIAKKENVIIELESYKKSLIYEVVTGKKEIV